ncbi:MAG: hypothetical protein AB7I50_04305 [Vicinamibacterales bacterium]
MSALGVSRLGGELAAAVPIVVLVGLQAFRLPIELVMHGAVSLGIMPVELSHFGYNFDNLTGAGALVIATALRRGVRVPRGVLWTWNVWGVWCLVAMAAIAIATSSLVRAFGDDPTHVNTWVLFFPYVWLPAGLIGPEADARRARVLPRMQQDPTGYPEAAGQGPFGPCDERAGRLLLGES